MSKSAKTAVILCAALLLGLFAYSPVISDTDYSESPLVIINGLAVATRPVNKDGILYMPPYLLARAFKANIDFDSSLNIIKIEGNMVQGKPIFIKGAVYVPLEAVVNGIGGTMKIDGKNNIIRIYTGAPPPPPPPEPPKKPPEPPPPPEPPVPTSGIFPPRFAQNPVFGITVTNVESAETIKGYYKPAPRNKFVIIYVQQQNISNEVQIYTGRFTLLDEKRNSYDYIEGLSNFWLIILRPGGINFGYMVFEVPSGSQPAELVLHSLSQSPLSVSLK
ncbi:MAG: DUF4352 domain-containing protein [Chloroflexi bacterium]|nr:DUF4352 domain-containing protein [Chloroflexota bacterium]